ncbi:AAA family ATPase [Hyphomicrobium sp.]|uniref:AAA family ATPase n=1 Tax=Hyphomicrobium sp. TaxID=82 RepID=UPI003F71DF49
MLTAIRKIEGLGVFASYTAAADLASFGQYNVIYGENGSGKTTLSRLFAVLETGRHDDHPDLNFTIATATGQVTPAQNFSRAVRVFNADYIEANIGQFDGPLRPILIVGKENRALVDEVSREKALHRDRTKRIDAANASVEKLENDKGKLFSAIAKTIGEATSGSTLRQYRKPDAERALAQDPNPAALTQDALDTHRATVRQEQMEALPPFTAPQLRTGADTDDILTMAGALPRQLGVLTVRTAQQGAIARLAETPALAAWAEEGLHLHEAHGTDRCAFCDQTLPPARLAALAEHFGAEDQRLKEEIEAATGRVTSITDTLAGWTLPARALLYAELRDGYDAAVTDFSQARAALSGQLADVRAAFDRKLRERARSYSDPVTLDIVPMTAAAEAIGDIIARHNAKCAGFDEAKAAARTALEKHYLSTVADQVREFDAAIAEQRALATGLTDGSADQTDPRSVKALTSSIEEKQAQISSAHAGGAALTASLRSFLGRTDLQFESDKDGYRVHRHGKPASRLSEGEKTAIAFLHFLVQLRDQSFDLAEGVVVIDDPISSLDSASMYQAFGFLKNAVKDAKQVFLLTHNFDFLQLLLNWLKNMRKDRRAFYMLVCTEAEDRRHARLAPLDKLLMEHPTEYHFLFKVLHEFRSDGTIQSSYHIPNVARKVLETFLEFHLPSNASLYDKMEAVDFDPQKKTVVYKFANDLSHATGKGFDPALVAETQKSVSYLLEMIKAVAPLHYDGLAKLSQAGPA